MSKLRTHTQEGYSYLHQPTFFGSVWIYFKDQLSWPDVLRWKGSVLLPTLPSVLFMTCFSCCIVLLRSFFINEIGIPISVLGTVSVALGLLLGFRVNTAYDRYWEGRKLVQAVMGTVRNIARQIWINIPENTENDHLEKMRVIKLLIAFFAATIHHLRGEFGINYPDLKLLLPPNWKPESVKKKSDDHRAEVPASEYPNGDEEQSVPDRRHDARVEEFITRKLQKEDHPYMEADNPTDIANLRRALIEQEFPDAGLGLNSTAYLSHHTSADMKHRALSENSRLIGTERGYGALMDKTKVKIRTAKDAIHHRFQTQSRKVQKRHLDHSEFCHEEDLPYVGDSELSLPLEILFKIALYVNEAKLAGKIESPLVSATTSSVDNLVNSFTAFERIVHTPIPKAYNIHLKQAVVLYIFFLPFALVETLGWLVAPVVAIVSFTLFGILAIGTEIENPFGYDDNDLPLGKYCDELKREVEYIIYHIPSKTTSILLDGQ